MKIWIAKRLIDRAVDDNKDIPAWITRLMERDENLRAYEASQRALVNRLRSDSSGWVLKSSIDASVAGGTPQVVKQPRFSAPLVVVFLSVGLAYQTHCVASSLWYCLPF